MYQVSEANVHLNAIFQNNESMPISSSNMEDLTLTCIDLEVFSRFYLDKIV